MDTIENTTVTKEVLFAGVDDSTGTYWEYIDPDTGDCVMVEGNLSVMADILDVANRGYEVVVKSQAAYQRWMLENHWPGDCMLMQQLLDTLLLPEVLGLSWLGVR